MTSSLGVHRLKNCQCCLWRCLFYWSLGFSDDRPNPARESIGMSCRKLCNSIKNFEILEVYLKFCCCRTLVAMELTETINSRLTELLVTQMEFFNHFCVSYRGQGEASSFHTTQRTLKSFRLVLHQLDELFSLSFLVISLRFILNSCQYKSRETSDSIGVALFCAYSGHGSWTGSLEHKMWSWCHEEICIKWTAKLSSALLISKIILRIVLHLAHPSKK